MVSVVFLVWNEWNGKSLSLPPKGGEERGIAAAEPVGLGSDG